MEKKHFVIIAIVFVLGGMLGYKLAPAPQSETKTVTQDRTVTVVKEVKKPDGTVIRDETRTEDSKKVESVVVAPPSQTIGGSALELGCSRVFIQ